MYIKCYAEPLDKYQRNYKIHLWDDEEGYILDKYKRTAYIECDEQEAECEGLNGEFIKETPKFKNADDGLHFHDINKLLTSFNALIEKGHSVICIEHNLDVIKT